jgi:cytochrome c peroxidase
VVACIVVGQYRLTARSWSALPSSAPIEVKTTSSGGSSSGRVTVQVTHLFDGAPLRFDDVCLRNRAGEMLSVSRLAYLVSDFSLLRADGSRVRLGGPVAYLNPGERRSSFVLKGVPAGHYAGVSFQIGLDRETNHRDPSGYAAGDPLHPLVNHLHWNWQGGYVFLALEGSYEQPGLRLGGYSYHLANDANRAPVILREELRLEGDAILDLQLDVARIFDGAHRIAIRAPGGESTHSRAGDRLAGQLKANIEGAFTLAGVASDSGSERSSAPDAGAATAASRRTLPPKRTTPFEFRIPTRFPRPQLPEDNPLTVEGVALGEKLFFEKRLSGSDTQSCASCHRPEHAFSDAGRAFSLGIDGKRGARNAMPLFNLAWSGAYTWDGRRTRLRDQALAPIQDQREMRQSLARTVTKLQADRDYPARFSRAFGEPGITAQRLGLALEQYLLTLVAADSKFDRSLRGEAKFSAEEERGMMLFMTEYDRPRGRMGGDCFHCHGGTLFTDTVYHNNGLDRVFRDRGRAVVTKRDADLGKFKTPSLRNVEVTGPYMHDGRFQTLEEVMEHYSTGVHRTKTLDPNIAKHPGEGGVDLTEADKKALVAFMKTLTDARYIRR